MSEMAIEYERRPITVEEYEQMAELGIIGFDERVELLDGELIRMAPMNPPHASSLGRLTRLMVTRLGEAAVVMPGISVRISRISEPQPDFTIMPPRDDFWAGEHATNHNALAVVECSDSSLAFDRGKKLRAYAAAGVAEYWIVNLRDRTVEIHRRPTALAFADRQIARPGDTIAFEAFPHRVFAVDEMLGPPVKTE